MNYHVLEFYHYRWTWMLKRAVYLGTTAAWKASETAFVRYNAEVWDG